MKQLNLLKTLFLLCALVVGSLNSWGAKITDYTKIVSGRSYYIGATTSSTDYYLSVDGSTVDTGVAGTAVTDKASATIFVFEGSGTSWAIKFKSSGNYLSLASTKANGKVDIVDSSTDWEAKNQSGKIRLTINGYALEKNNSGTQFGSYASTQTDVWLEEIDLPTHTASFSINGVIDDGDNDVVEEGGDITFPADPEIDGLEFMGWTTTPIVGTTDTEPAVLVKSATMSTADITYYAVFAKKTTVAGIQTYTLNFDTDVSSKTLGYGTAVDVTASDGSSWVVKAYKNNGMQINVGKDSSIKIPTCSGNIQSIVITCKQAKAVGLSASDYSGSGVITYLVSGTDALSQTLDLSGESVTAGYIVPKGGSTAITNIDVNFNGLVDIYSAYCTSVPTIAVSVTSVKYATFCDEIARDFSASGITVYAATATSTKVDFDEVTDGIVPANTGVVLYSATTKSDVAIPAAATASSYDFSSNEMIGINAKTSIAYAGEGSKKNYILANGTSGVGFYKAAVGGANLAAHKAYLSTTAAVTGRDFLGFEDETTGIEKVEAAQQSVGEYYNLAGQRVANPTKGLYIVNGKKVIK